VTGSSPAAYTLCIGHPGTDNAQISNLLRFVGAPTDGARAELPRVPVFRMAEEIHSPDTDVATSDAAAARRAQRARDEAMTVSLRRTGGIYDVHSESGHTYRVDIGAETCSCPDWQEREPEGGCKHLRRVRLDVRAGRVPTPDGRLPKVTSTDGGSPRAAPDGGQAVEISGPHPEFDRYGLPMCALREGGDPS
jgi:hypothetical protein